ncbi:MAG: 50S ribosomal protein L33 [Verrucomicrobiae bacterium]|nr:50S ribosomal protein L33 [Verrucomicrobiae bacterium]
MPRELITLACGECKSRNYTSTRNKKQGSARLELRKFCPKCRRHVVHKETK